MVTSLPVEKACELDGQRICSCTDPSALDVLIRKHPDFNWV